MSSTNDEQPYYIFYESYLIAANVRLLNGFVNC